MCVYEAEAWNSLLPRLEIIVKPVARALSALVLTGSACTGCSVSLINYINSSDQTTIADVLLNTISLKYHPQLSAAAGDLAVGAVRSTQQAGGYVLVVEGSIPTADGGRYCYVWDEGGRSVTMAEAVRSLADNAQYVVAVGTCASFGGVTGAYSGAGAKGVGSFLGRSVVNLPGCPPHPDWIVGSLVKILSGSMPALDSNSRPTSYYTPEVIHERCPREEAEEASQFGQNGYCLGELGCRGPSCHADCDMRKWNNKQGYCIGVNGLCIGCTEPNFPAFPLHTAASVSGGATPTPIAGTTPVPVDTPTPGPGGIRTISLPHIVKGR